MMITHSERRTYSFNTLLRHPRAHHSASIGASARWFVLPLIVLAACSASTSVQNGSGAGGTREDSDTGGVGGQSATNLTGHGGAAADGFAGAGGQGGSGINDLPHRPVAEECPVSTDRSHPGSDDRTCQTDADCQGYAAPTYGIDVKGRCLPSKQCSYDQCTRDEDCGTTGVCSCQGQTFGFSHSSPGNICVPSNCRLDSDCASGKLCSASWQGGSFFGVRGFYCHTTADLCAFVNDCSVGNCEYSSEAAAWTCNTFYGAG